MVPVPCSGGIGTRAAGSAICECAGRAADPARHRDRRSVRRPARRRRSRALRLRAHAAGARRRWLVQRQRSRAACSGEPRWLPHRHAERVADRPPSGRDAGDPHLDARRRSLVLRLRRAIHALHLVLPLAPGLWHLRRHHHDARRPDGPGVRARSAPQPDRPDGPVRTDRRHPDRRRHHAAARQYQPDPGVDRSRHSLANRDRTDVADVAAGAAAPARCAPPVRARTPVLHAVRVRLRRPGPADDLPRRLHRARSGPRRRYRQTVLPALRPRCDHRTAALHVHGGTHRATQDRAHRDRSAVCLRRVPRRRHIDAVPDRSELPRWARRASTPRHLLAA